jgi:hypothetical protein
MDDDETRHSPDVPASNVPEEGMYCRAYNSDDKLLGCARKDDQEDCRRWANEFHEVKYYTWNRFPC